MSPQCKNHIVLDFQILRVCQIINMEKLLYLMNTLLCEIYHLVLLIDDKISCFLLLHTHDGIHLGILRQILTTSHLARQNIAGLI